MGRLKGLPKCKGNKKSKRSDDSHSSAKLQKSRVSYVSYIHTSYTKHTVLDLSNVRSNHAPLNYSGQESEKNLQFMILTYLWP